MTEGILEIPVCCVKGCEKPGTPETSATASRANEMRGVVGHVIFFTLAIEKAHQNIG
jgi:hypothetical protein